ncbi:MAG: flagellar protein FlgN [Treponemataceae bacterium]|uniref:flagellar export chaperone FlgN n=1 Tax=Treponema sp. J25 TaxID=2094121 RepID=UPI001047219B|nr:flagellar export chaperone FlgN [Treponema sp. J25]MCX7949168.1 flagellar protein FlgN [Treponemataceae bacterium]TCW62533.1 hypothetical protein C5O22_00300 [Treponema sp. J25]HOM23567.1 flagellar export chaperone FlgN [Termitinemataceae bacterium]HPP99852.1 flagellar export chaperone FlgN [Termitinemataceae bacterium]
MKMKKTHNPHEEKVTLCLQLLREEVALIERISATQEILRSALSNREFEDLHVVLERLQNYNEEFVALEEKRNTLFKELAHELEVDPLTTPFYGIVCRLPEPERREITDAYRQLKIGTLRVRLANETLQDYVTFSRSLLQEVLQVAFPDRRGKMYTPDGKERHPEMRSLILNKTL